MGNDDAAPNEPPEPAASTSPAGGESAGSRTMAELNDQLAYFGRESGKAKVRYQRLRVLTLVLAASIPVVAAAGGDVVISAVLGALIVVCEGSQQLFGYHDRWVEFRSNWNALSREKRLYLSGAGPYAGAGAGDRERMLSERFEEVMAADSITWRASAGKKQDDDS